MTKMTKIYIYINFTAPFGAASEKMRINMRFFFTLIKKKMTKMTKIANFGSFFHLFCKFKYEKMFKNFNNFSIIRKNIYIKNFLTAPFGATSEKMRINMRLFFYINKEKNDKNDEKIYI